MKATISIPDAHAYGADEAWPSRIHGQDVADAAYNTVHNYPGGVRAIAARMGMSPNTLTHKVNPNTPTHHLSLREAISVQYFSGNFAILHAMAEELGHTVTRATPDQAGGEPIETMMRLHMEFADLLRALADAVPVGDGSVSGNQMRRADHHAQEAIAAIGHALAMLRRRMRGTPEGRG